MTIEQHPFHAASPEFRLVAACSWSPRNAAQQSALIASLSTDSLNWNEVVALVTRHALAGVFSLVMGRLAWVNVPAEIVEHLKGLRLKQAVRALGQTAELSRVCSLLSGHGVDVLPLKGVALSQELYGDPAVRSSGDLDIMVRTRDVAKAEGLLVKLGYRHVLGFHSLSAQQQLHILKALHHHEYVKDAKGMHLELHWRGYLWTDDQTALLWDASSPASGFGCTFRQLSKEDGILFLCDHGARHSWQSLKWLSDVAMLAENLPENEWQAIYDRAACFDLQRVLLQTSLLLEWVYGIKPPARFEELIAADRKTAKLAASCAPLLLASREQLAVQLKRFIGPRQACTTKMLKPSTSLSALLRNVLIKPEDFLELPLPNGLFWLYPIMRPYLWFRRHYLSRQRK